MKKLLIFAAVWLLSVGVQAAQTLTINGETVQKAVVTMTFEDNNVILTFADQTSQTADMASVVLTFSAEQSAIYSLKSPVGAILGLDNLTPGTEIVVYDATGKKMLSTRAEKASESISIENLKSGVYILKANRQAVKFVKH